MGWTLHPKRGLQKAQPLRDCRQSSAQSDGVLAGDALGAALSPGVCVLPGPGAATGHQALLEEAEAAERSARLPRARCILVHRAPEGRWKGGAKESAGNLAGREAAVSFPSSYPSIIYRPLLPSLWLSAFFQ